MAILIHTTGYIETFDNDEHDLSLEELQRAVGGSIEHIYTSDEGNDVVVNEEGKINGSLPNPVATTIMAEHLGGLFDVLYGDVLLFEKGEFK